MIAAINTAFAQNIEKTTKIFKNTRQTVQKVDYYQDGKIDRTVYMWFAIDNKYSSSSYYTSEAVAGAYSIEEIEEIVDEIIAFFNYDTDTSGTINGNHVSRFKGGVYYSHGEYKGYTMFTKGDVNKIKKAIQTYKS